MWASLTASTEASVVCWRIVLSPNWYNYHRIVLSCCRIVPIVHWIVLPCHWIILSPNCSGVARNFSQGVRNSDCLQSSIDVLHCFCQELNAWSLITCRTSSTETCSQKLWICIMANKRRWRHIDEELSKFVGVDVSWGWRRPLSRDKTDETNR